MTDPKNKLAIFQEDKEMVWPLFSFANFLSKWKAAIRREKTWNLIAKETNSLQQTWSTWKCSCLATRARRRIRGSCGPQKCGLNTWNNWLINLGGGSVNAAISNTKGHTMRILHKGGAGGVVITALLLWTQWRAPPWKICYWFQSDWQ